MTENQEKSTPSGAAPIPRPFRPYGIAPDYLESFELEGLAERLRDEPAYGREGRASVALVRSGELTVFLTVMRAGVETAEHLTPGPATLVVLAGRVRFKAQGESHELGTHEAMLASGEMPHVVAALADSVFLLVVGGKEPAA